MRLGIRTSPAAPPVNDVLLTIKAETSAVNANEPRVALKSGLTKITTRAPSGGLVTSNTWRVQTNSAREVRVVPKRVIRIQLVCADRQFVSVDAISHADFARAKHENAERLERLRGEGRIAVRLGTRPMAIRMDAVNLEAADGTLETLPNDVVFSNSSLTSFLQCPYLHFAEKWLRLDSLPGREITPLEVGKVLHAVLRDCFAPERRDDPLEILGRRYAELAARKRPAFRHRAESRRDWRNLAPRRHSLDFGKPSYAAVRPGTGRSPKRQAARR